MTNELTVQQELTMLRQQNEILTLRGKLETLQAEKASQMEDSLYSPKLYEHYKRVAEDVCKSSMVPKAYMGKPHDAFVAMAMGYQLGLPIEQSLQHIAVVNGRPCLWGDGMLALIMGHKECEDVEELPLLDSNNQVVGYQCTVKRKGKSPHTKQYTIDDAKKAGLLGKGNFSPWVTNPSRMLQMRARAFALRDRFPDLLSGIKMAEEVRDYDEGETIDVKPSAKDALHQAIQKNMGIGSLTTQGVQNAKTDAMQSGNVPQENVPTIPVVEASKETGQDQEYADVASAGDAESGHNLEVDTNYVSETTLEKIHDIIYERKIPESRVATGLKMYNALTIEELSEENAQKMIKIFSKGGS